MRIRLFDIDFELAMQVGKEKVMVFGDTVIRTCPREFMFAESHQKIELDVDEIRKSIW